jgi:hypothetical protein
VYWSRRCPQPTRHSLPQLWVRTLLRPSGGSSARPWPPGRGEWSLRACYYTLRRRCEDRKERKRPSAHTSPLHGTQTDGAPRLDRERPVRDCQRGILLEFSTFTSITVHTGAGAVRACGRRAGGRAGRRCGACGGATLAGRAPGRPAAGFLTARISPCSYSRSSSRSPFPSVWPRDGRRPDPVGRPIDHLHRGPREGPLLSGAITNANAKYLWTLLFVGWAPRPGDRAAAGAS